MGLLALKTQCPLLLLATLFVLIRLGWTSRLPRFSKVGVLRYSCVAPVLFLLLLTINAREGFLVAWKVPAHRSGIKAPANTFTRNPQHLAYTRCINGQQAAIQTCCQPPAITEQHTQHTAHPSDQCHRMLWAQLELGAKYLSAVGACIKVKSACMQT